jgi:hypothetical protein
MACRKKKSVSVDKKAVPSKRVNFALFADTSAWQTGTT